MSSLCSSALASLDDSLALLWESLEKLKAAKAVDIAEVIEQLKMTAECARVVRELVWSELPETSWQNREELDALIEKIQKSLAARTLEQLRSRLLALATELERGNIVHRRAHRLNELNQLRDQAINELRTQAGLEGAPQTLPGPQADQWIQWAWGLKEPQDAEPLQILRNGFAHLDDFVANLEPNMWIAAGSPTLEILPAPERSADQTPSKPSEVLAFADALPLPLAVPDIPLDEYVKSFRYVPPEDPDETTMRGEAEVLRAEAAAVADAPAAVPVETTAAAAADAPHQNRQHGTVSPLPQAIAGRTVH
jgi:hypothetical protein